MAKEKPFNVFATALCALCAMPTFADAVSAISPDGAWYAGGITTIEARDCELDTSFLGGGEWTAEIFRDAGDAKEDAQKYVHETRKVKAGEHLPFHMAPGGGFVIRFSK